MKKLILVLPLLLSGMMISAMDKMGASIQRYDPFMQFPSPNAPKLSEEKISALIKNGQEADLAHEIVKGLKADHKFTSGEYVGKSLLQVALAHSITNRHEIASMLLKRGAHAEELNPFLTTAIKKFDPAEVKWLLDHGAKPASDTQAVVSILEKSAPGDKKEKMIQIKKLLEERQLPAMSVKPAAVTEAHKPVVQQPKVRTELPVVKKFDKKDQFTVLSERKEAELFKVILSGNDEKLTKEYLDEGLSPDFKFTLGSPGKTLLELAVTQAPNSNQEKIAGILLAYGANPNGLQAGLPLAIKEFKKSKVEWLLAKGAQPTADMIEQATELEKTAKEAIRQKIAGEIKVLLKEHKPAQYSKPLPPVPGRKPAGTVVRESESIEPIANIYGNKK